MPRLKAFKWDAWARERASRYLADMPDVVAVDTETPGTAYFDEPFCATLSWRGADGSLQNAYIAFEGEGREDRIDLVKGLLTWTPTWVFHNAKFDLQKLELVGALPDRDGHRIEDTQAIYHLLDENGLKGLKHLAVHVLKYDDTILVPYASGKKKGQLRPVAKEKHQLDQARKAMGLRVEDGYLYLPREVVVPYALRDTDFTLQLYEKLKPALEAKNDPALLELYEQEIALIDVFLRVEGNGFAIDRPYLEAKASEYGERVMELWTELTEIAPDVAPDSPKQVLPYLQDVRGLKVEDTRKTTLKKLDDEYARKLLEYREAKKIHKTYLVALLNEQRDGIVHPWFNTIGPRTGRMSSGAAHE